MKPTKQQIEAATAAFKAAHQALEAYSEALREIADDLQARFDDKSERWQDGEAGQTAANLIAEWETAADDVDPGALPDPGTIGD